MRWNVNAGRMLIGRIAHGKDLLEELTREAREAGITLARVEALGAVSRASVGFYSQSRQEYEYADFDRPMEILSLIGNVSLKDGETFVHAHIALGEEDGSMKGGHLAPGTTVFACEFLMQELSGAELSRAPDSRTGLSLWPQPV